MTTDPNAYLRPTREGLRELGRRLGYSDKRINSLFAKADNERQLEAAADHVRREHLSLFKDEHDR